MVMASQTFLKLLPSVAVLAPAPEVSGTTDVADVPPPDHSRPTTSRRQQPCSFLPALESGPSGGATGSSQAGPTGQRAAAAAAAGGQSSAALRRRRLRPVSPPAVRRRPLPPPTMDRSVRQRRGDEEPTSSPLRSLDGNDKDHQSDEWLSRRGRNMVLVILLYVVVCTGVFIWFQVGRQPPKLLVLSVSSLRHDYLSKIPSRDAPFFTHFLRYGSRAEYLSPAFPSGGVAPMTSVYTGLYPEKHGVLGEHFMDRKEGELRIKGPAGHSADDAVWWGGSIPFWNSAIKQWRKTAVFNVPGGCVPFDGYAPHTCTAPSDEDDFSENLSRALDLLLKEEHGYNLAVVHTNVLRTAAEEQGADSRRLLDELLTLDARLQQMDRELLDLQMRDQINIVIVSDGGLTDTETAEVIHIDKYLPPEVGVTIAGNGAVCYIYADDAHHDLVYGVIGNVPGAKTYRKHEIPERYHLTHPNRVPDVLLVAAPGTFIENTVPLVVAAAGGYDDTEGDAPDMRGVLLARGPSFKHGVVVQPVKSVDVYPLLTALLDVTSEVHSGSLQRTTDMVNW